MITGEARQRQRDKDHAAAVEAAAGALADLYGGGHITLIDREQGEFIIERLRACTGVVIP